MALEYIIAGIDEAGRGPLAGPVVAAAVILNPSRRINGLADSKVLSEKKREELYLRIQEHALAWAVGSADVLEIDTINILQASLLAMQRAVEALSITPHIAFVDGNQAPKLMCEVKTMVNGDALHSSISAASIIAKVTRDREMTRLAEHYPHYGFEQHKGYGTREHLAALERHGVCNIHRRSYAPVARLLVRETV
ncbi:MAG: ribonuclease HII [Pseudomonadota bacterium]